MKKKKKKAFHQLGREGGLPAQSLLPARLSISPRTLHLEATPLGPADELGTEGRAWGWPAPAQETSTQIPALPQGLAPPPPPEDRGHPAGGTRSSAVWDAVSGQVSGYTPTPAFLAGRDLPGRWSQAGPHWSPLQSRPHLGVRRHRGVWRAPAAQGPCLGARTGRTAHRRPTWRVDAGDITSLPGSTSLLGGACARLRLRMESRRVGRDAPQRAVL